MNLVFEWILAEGGVDAFAKRNADKAKIIYDAIDNSGGFYKGHSYVECRSDMNITFHLPSEELEKKFLKESAEHSMSGLAGHRSLKGIRASIYNAFPAKGCEFLASVMNDFASRNG